MTETMGVVYLTESGAQEAARRLAGQGFAVRMLPAVYRREPIEFFGADEPSMVIVDGRVIPLHRNPDGSLRLDCGPVILYRLEITTTGRECA